MHLNCHYLGRGGGEESGRGGVEQGGWVEGGMGIEQLKAERRHACIT